MGDIFNKAIALNEISRGAKRCCRGAGHKAAAQAWKTENIERCEALQYSIVAGKHKPGHGAPFKIYEPKERDILPPLFRDRVWQNDLCENGVYDALTKSLIYDCGACRKEMGTEFSIYRMIAALEKFFRKYGDNQGVARHLDIRKYFPSTPRKESKRVISTHIHDDRAVIELNNIFDSFVDGRPEDVIANDQYGVRGTGLGSPVSQLVQLSLLDRVDQMMVREPAVEYYQRTMDDLVFITRDKVDADRLEAVIREIVGELGFEMTDKGGNNKLKNGFYYLKKKFILTNTGKVIVVPIRAKMEKERRTLRKHKKLHDMAMLSMEEIQVRYECWVSTMMLCDCGSRLKQMDAYFQELFGCKPIYKCKRKPRRRVKHV